jgi:HAD superfamily hydrolase (TIGR01509 family)
MKTIRGVLWDNDGVLVDTEQLFYECNRDLLLPYGIDLTPKQFFDWFLDNNYGAWHVLLGQGHGIELVDRLRAERKQLFGARLRQARRLAMPGIAPVLAALRPHVAMGVVTSAYAQHFDISHAATGLLPHFDFVLTREMYGDNKPAPDGYWLGLQRLGLDAAHCVAVEDSPRGLRAAMRRDWNASSCATMNRAMPRRRLLRGRIRGRAGRRAGILRARHGARAGN